ncbi:MAG: hypothetical protein HC886_21640 [Leptolyngbyaceae cyanobacterium SM1_1_3]|nr:hypothetical protein [Leptolyngbyaceae cyanobacterium SM1_1_3]NJN03922.1 hypothetical protein [Leptolyngbyaceae cyanobacterium RM1_1_2]NJO11705.1 hypothetical protein [Leptolyngbyaceae cyanobacterium SL_1_1]
MARLWLLCFVFLFALAEGYQWVADFPWLTNTELPLAIAGGMLLAIVSNYGRLKASSPASSPVRVLPDVDLPGHEPEASSSAGFIPAGLESAEPPSRPSTQASASSPKRSISFEIHKPQRLQWQAFRQGSNFEPHKH